ncbi:MAG: hypothetical protein B6242_10560 [Anaerolineaceae bacterium 4572_78]|nr:MAG: hypothetical protein B6242_10560 [Anaerolineaceae bacterium 4572_78]
MLEITKTEYKRCDLVHVKGRIDAATFEEFQKPLNASVGAGKYNIVVNMSDVDFMASAGLRALIETHKACKKMNRGILVLSELTPKIKDMLNLAGVISIFTVYENDVDAVGSF